MKIILITIALGTFYALVSYMLLRHFGSSEATFYGLVAFFSIVLACFVSPSKNILLGAKRLWLFDWIGTLVMSAAICAIGSPAESASIKIIRFMSFFAFLAAGAISVRRGRTGKK